MIRFVEFGRRRWLWNVLFEEGVYVFILKGERHVQSFWNDKKAYAIVDRNGQVQYRAAAGQIQDVKGFRNGLTPVKTKTGWGIMDYQGQWIVKPQYKDITMV